MSHSRKVCAALLAFAVLLTAACAGAKSPAMADLQHRGFVLVSVDGAPFTGYEKTPDIEFGQDFRVSGQVCNRYFGQGVLENGILTVGQMASTKMMCAEDALNRLEDLLAQMLVSGAEVSLADNTLTLRQGGHELVFTARDWVR